MKILLVNGSPHQHGCTYTALDEAARTLNVHGIETEILWLGTKAMQGCIACGGCKKDGCCVFDDEVARVTRELDGIDGFIFGTPVYYGGPSGTVQAFMDRLFHSAGRRMAGKVAAAVVSCRRGGSTAAFQSMNMYFQMTNMIVITSQYWNQIHGNTRQEALQDAEGLQTMRILAENMRYVLQCLSAGKEKGVAPLTYEMRTATNFIR